MTVPYCGTPPDPTELLTRFNLDPVLACSLVALTAAHLMLMGRGRRARGLALSGWLIAALALISPLCALSVSLFSARVGQHMVLLLVAAPLVALALPAPSVARERQSLWLSATAFLVALWFWHMPAPYDATFESSATYWLMHATLFGSALALWRSILHHSRSLTGEVLLVGGVTSMHMGLLGAVLTLGGHPLFYPHLLTTYVWGLTPLQDQQLGGALMWVPGIALFLWAGIRSLRQLWLTLESSKPA